MSASLPGIIDNKPRTRTLSDIKAKLLEPALTSHFQVTIPLPPKINADRAYLSSNGIRMDQDKMNLLCCDAVLPGSSLATHDITNDRHGVTERHVHRRIFDDSLDLTFYVDADNYLPIRLFETWIKFCVGEESAIRQNTYNSGDVRPGVNAPDYFYRMNYPDEYIAKQGLTVTKFERSYKETLTYNFVNVFPRSVNSMPVSYEASSLLKCSVSFSYIRYYVTPGSSGTAESDPKNTSSSPDQQSDFNNSQFSTGSTVPELTGLSGTGALKTGGIPQLSSTAAANSVSVAFDPNTRLF